MMPERERKGQWSCETYKCGKLKTECQIAFFFFFFVSLYASSSKTFSSLLTPPPSLHFLKFIYLFLISWYKSEVKSPTPSTDRQHLSVALRPLQFLLGGGQKGGGFFKPFTTVVLFTHISDWFNPWGPAQTSLCI